MYSRYQLGCRVAACLLWAALCAAAQVPAAQGFKVLYTFDSVNFADGGGPSGVMAVDGRGVLYGTTQYGGAYTGCIGATGPGCGTVYSLTPPTTEGGAWTETVLWSFGQTDADIYSPVDGVTMGADGALYGVSGATDSVFSVSPPTTQGGAWTEAVIYVFSGAPDGRAPSSSLAVDVNGVLYGTTGGGGTGKGCGTGCGTVYSLAPPVPPRLAWTETVLWSFGRGDGTDPVGGVVIGPGGVLYGVTQSGGTGGNGIVYSLAPPAEPGGAWTESVLYNFPQSASQYPVALALSANGVLYGTTYLKDKDEQQGGTVFSLTPPETEGGTWTEATLHTFPPEPYHTTYSDEPTGPLFIAQKGGLLFGATAYRGESAGTLFVMIPPEPGGVSWTEHVMYSALQEPSLGAKVGGVLYGTDNLSNTVWSFIP